MVEYDHSAIYLALVKERDTIENNYTLTNLIN